VISTRIVPATPITCLAIAQFRPTARMIALIMEPAPTGLSRGFASVTKAGRGATVRTLPVLTTASIMAPVSFTLLRPTARVFVILATVEIFARFLAPIGVPVMVPAPKLERIPAKVCVHAPPAMEAPTVLNPSTTTSSPQPLAPLPSSPPSTKVLQSRSWPSSWDVCL